MAASAGDGDLSIQVYARDNQELLRFVDEVVGRLGGVLQTRTVVVPWKLKDVYEWQIPETGDRREGVRPDPAHSSRGQSANAATACSARLSDRSESAEGGVCLKNNWRSRAKPAASFAVFPCGTPSASAS